MVDNQVSQECLEYQAKRDSQAMLDYLGLLDNWETQEEKDCLDPLVFLDFLGAKEN